MSSSNPRYSTNPKSIASRERAKNWDEDRKLLYKRQQADAVAVSKRIKKLRETSLWQDANADDQKNMEARMREEVLDDRMRKGLHSDVFENHLRDKADKQAAEENAKVTKIIADAETVNNDLETTSSESDFAGTYTRYMLPITHIIEQRILHYGGLKELKDAGDPEALRQFTEFANKHASAHNAKDRVIPNPMQVDEDEPDDIVEEDEFGNQTRHKAKDDQEDEEEYDYELTDSSDEEDNEDEEDEMEMEI